jgi:phage terminase large subunit-like protein
MLIARKNAKSATCAAIALASLVCDGIQGSEIYLLGNTKD